MWTVNIRTRKVSSNAKYIIIACKLNFVKSVTVMWAQCFLKSAPRSTRLLHRTLVCRVWSMYCKYVSTFHHKNIKMHMLKLKIIVNINKITFTVTDILNWKWLFYHEYSVNPMSTSKFGAPYLVLRGWWFTYHLL